MCTVNYKKPTVIWKKKKNLNRKFPNSFMLLPPAVPTESHLNICFNLKIGWLQVDHTTPNSGCSSSPTGTALLLLLLHSLYGSTKTAVVDHRNFIPGNVEKKLVLLPGCPLHDSDPNSAPSQLRFASLTLARRLRSPPPPRHQRHRVQCLALQAQRRQLCWHDR